MDRIRITGGNPLSGSIPIGGAKNAALPLMAASLLTADTLTLSNIPRLVDVSTMARLLAEFGVEIAINGEAGDGGGAARVFELTAGAANGTTAPYDLVRKMRASVLVLGPLLGRYGRAKVSLPGGCAIGTRPLDLHLGALAELGADIELSKGYIEATAPTGLKGAHIVFPMVTVGGTENLLMAAVLADGDTVLANAAREPEVADLANCLVAMGAGIEGIGTDTLRVHGVKALKGAAYRVVPDRIEMGTYAVAVAVTGGDAELTGARLDLMESLADILGKGRGVGDRNRGGTAGFAEPRALDGGRRDDRAVPRLSDRHAGPTDGLDGGRQGRVDDHRDHLREPFHARARAVPDGRRHQRPRRVGHRQGGWRAVRGRGYGDRSQGLGVAGPGRPRGARRNGGQSRLPPGPRLRAAEKRS